MQIKLIKSTFYNEQETKDAVCDFIQSATHLSIGPQCNAFEREFSNWQGRGHSVMFNSGSSANLALIQALMNLGRLHKGEKIAFSGITWATNVMPLIQLGLEPIPVDVELHTLNVSFDTLKKAHEAHGFTAFFLTDLLGFASDIGRIAEYCREHGILLIEDNCESLWSVIAGKKLGNFGVAATFSFFVGHHMSTLEGGMVSTDDEALSNELKMVRSHGWDRNLPPEDQAKIRSRHGISSFYAKYTFYDLGYNLRPTEINGFIGLNQIRFLDEIVAKREANYQRFLSIFDRTDEFIPLSVSMDTVSNFAFPLIAKNKETMEKYVSLLDASGVEIRPIVGWLMTHQPFFQKYIAQPYSLPNAEYIHDHGFYFWNNPEMSDEEVDYILNLFWNA